MKRDNIEVIGGFLMIVALPWLAFTECLLGNQDRDYRGRRRGIASGGILGCIAWISFAVQVFLLILLGLFIGALS